MSPTKRPGADAGWRVLFAFSRPLPRAAQAGSKGHASATMSTERRKVCEVLVSTVIVSVTTVALNWAFAIVRNWQGQTGVGSLLLGFLGGIFFGLLTMGIFIVPSAFVVSVVIATLKRWSSRAIATLLSAVVVCSSVSAYLIDPTQSRATDGPAGYFARFDWFASEFTLTAVVTGLTASLIAFWAVLRCRRRYGPVA